MSLLQKELVLADSIVDSNQEDNDQKELEEAVRVSNIEKVQKLVKNGVNIFHKYSGGSTALDMTTDPALKKYLKSIDTLKK
jgi:hypothetical protein